MQELRDLARTELIQGFVVEPPFMLSTDNVQGIDLEIDWFWLRSFRTNYSWRVEGIPATDSYRTSKVIDGGHLNFDWRPKGWLEHSRARQYPKDAHPVSIKVLLRKEPEKAFLAEAPRNLGPHPIRYELRSACVAYSNAVVVPGSKVWCTRVTRGSGIPVGTLGGFLRDSSSWATYAVSCEHVLGGPGNQLFCSPPTGPAPAAPIGEVRFAVAPPASSAKSKCNRVTQPTAVPDLAIAELYGSISHHPGQGKLGVVNRLTRIMDMTSGDPVSFLGAESGQVDAKLGCLNLWREAQIDGVPHCIGDMFTLEPAEHWYVRPHLSRPGDSGAWILSNDNAVVGWDGMLFGGDGAQIYCCFAELVHSTCLARYPNLILDS